MASLLEALRRWDAASARVLRGHGAHGCEVALPDGPAWRLTNTQADRLAYVLDADAARLERQGGAR
ncbi:hypothetical protein [Streptomyces hoynatensis]|uniref:Uncharacterized protein n=1 Tax=Streptomyces hoynatensis TaxID=1141874 RepID=A0A3A9YXJ4_9ACTN|nr:hypothetical protein [Streptomyces hoynatensis]RKN40781.1 hypothetical protein D7294_16975 [Streptomyces hoynatensis]